MDDIPLIFRETNLRIVLEELERIHGLITWTENNRGWHLNMASPEALRQDGAIELQKRHLSFNVTKLCFLQRRPYSGNRAWDKAMLGLCHKTDVTYCMAELLRFPTLEDRGFPRNEVYFPSLPGDAIATAVVDSSAYEEFCPTWNRPVPKPAGTLIPLTQLTADHPVLEYLRWRNFNDLAALESQLGAAFCCELREDYPSKYIPPHGFPITPLGRLIFRSWQRGVVLNWQGRLLEMDVEAGWRVVWHPLTQQWEKLGRTHPEMGFRYVDEYATWKVPKYLFPTKSEKNITLMGFDAAEASGLRDKWGHRYAILVEGAFDAARLGPPTIAIMGKYLSGEGVHLLRQHFDRLFFVADNDAPGKEGLEKSRNILKKMAPHIKFSPEDLPSHVKDAAELSVEEAVEFKAQMLSHF